MPVVHASLASSTAREGAQDRQDLRFADAKRDQTGDNRPCATLHPPLLLAQATNFRPHRRITLSTALGMERQILTLARVEFPVTQFVLRNWISATDCPVGRPLW